MGKESKKNSYFEIFHHNNIFNVLKKTNFIHVGLIMVYLKSSHFFIIYCKTLFIITANLGNERPEVFL